VPITLLPAAGEHSALLDLLAGIALATT